MRQDMATTHYTQEDTELANSLPQKVEQLRLGIDAGRPYVWELRLSLDEFCTLETAVKKSIRSHSNDHQHLLTEKFALIVVIYLAEWYKRFYKGAETLDEEKALSLNTEELKKLYGLAKIDSNTFVYNASANPDKTSFRWQESLQVLGGLAVQAELNRDKRDPLLPQLCKIFHGEEIQLDEVKDRNRAVAFQESIARGHSLYEYLDCILDKDKEPPFAREDLQNEDTMIPQLMSRIMHADELAKKNKFDFEWVIAYNGNRKQMVRHLRVRLRPEVIGGGKRQYIGYDRLRTPEWGVEHPEEIGRIKFHLRFKDGRRTIKKEGKDDAPLFKYDNTGSEETGFLSVNRMDESICTDVPVSHFDKVEMVMKTGDTTRVVQELEVKDYQQLYLMKNTDSKFSSRRNDKALLTVLVFSPAYRLAAYYRDLSVEYAHYWNGEERSEDYCWCPISDKVILVGPDGKEVTPPFFNRSGLYQVVFKKYLETIKYKENLYVAYKEIDPEDEGYEEAMDAVPVLFGRSGLRVVHYATGKAAEGEPVNDYDLEWQQPNGRYTDWKTQAPGMGKIRLRVTVKGIVIIKNVFYVPFVNEDGERQPIWRDFERMRICTDLEGVEDIQDHFEKNYKAHQPSTRKMEIGNDREKIWVDVYRPIRLRELSLKENEDKEPKIVEYGGMNDDLQIPLIDCGRFSIRDFSEKGVKEYALRSDDVNYYHYPTFNHVGLSVNNYLTEIAASELWDDIPLDYLKIYISKAMDNRSDLYAWNYKEVPWPVGNDSELREDGIVFQSLKEHPIPRHYALPTIKKAKAIWGGKKSQTVTDVLQCFETAAEHNTYFFLFNPLIKTVQDRKQIKDIALPLMKKREYKLTNGDKEQLYKMAVHFHFDWLLLPRETWRQQIDSTAGNEEERKMLKKAVTDFLAASPKWTDERERACLKDFMDVYWNFDSYPHIESTAEKALQLILNRSEATGKSFDMKAYLIEFDTCRCKFSEMSKAIIS